MTVGPGETATFDLRNMTTWQLREDWEGIRYALDYAGSAFDVSLDGSIVTVVGADRAVPGAEEAAIVSVTSHTAVAPVRLILRVGAAPSTLPQGGSLTQQCTQASGSSCSISVIGAVGRGQPAPAHAARGHRRASGRRVRRRDLQRRVRDIRHRHVGAGRARGRPAPRRSRCATRRAGAPTPSGTGSCCSTCSGIRRRPPASRQTAYADGTLTLRVDPGEARQAYPALTGFVIRSNDQVVADLHRRTASARRSRRRTASERTYQAFAVNAVGESRTSVRTVGWAYDPPPAPASGHGASVVTGGEGGVVALSIDGHRPRRDRQRRDHQRDGRDRAHPRRPRPDDAVEVPPLPGRDQHLDADHDHAVLALRRAARARRQRVSGAAVTISANGIGAPRDVRSRSAPLERRRHLDGDGVARAPRSGGDGSTLRYGIVREGSPCDQRRRGPSDLPRPPGRRGVSLHRLRRVLVRRRVVRPHDGDRVGARAAVRQGARGMDVRGGCRAQRLGLARRVDHPAESDLARALPNQNRVEFAGWGPRHDASSTATPPAGALRPRVVGDATPWASVTPRAGSAPYQVQARWWVESCVGGSDLVAARRLVDRRRRRQGGDLVRRPPACATSTRRALLPPHAGHLDASRSARCGSRASPCPSTGRRRAGGWRPRARRSRRRATRTCPARRAPGAMTPVHARAASTTQPSRQRDSVHDHHAGAGDLVRADVRPDSPTTWSGPSSASATSSSSS